MLIPLGFLNAGGYIPTGLYWFSATSSANLSQGISGKAALASDGSLYISGYVSDDVGNSLGMTLKMNSATGAFVWARGVRTNVTDGNSGVVLDSTGAIYSVGNAGNADFTLHNDVITKHAADGTRTWVRSFGGTLSNYYFFSVDIAKDPSDGIYLVGNRFVTAGATDSAMVVVKYTAAGALSFQRRLVSSSQSLYGRAGAADANGIVAVGSEKTIAKWNTSGTLQWQRQFPSDSGVNGRWNGVALDSASNIYTTGPMNFTTNGSIVLKLTAAGAVSWARSIAVTSPAEVTLSYVFVNGTDVYVTGNYATSGSSDSTSTIILKFTDGGTLTWARLLGFDSSSDDGKSVTIASNGDLLITAAGQIGNTQIARLPADGSMIGTYAWNGNALKYTNAASVITVSTMTNSVATSTHTAGTPTYTSATPTVLQSTSPTFTFIKTEI